MEEYKELKNRRRKKQYAAASFFVFFAAAGPFYPVLGLLIPLCMFLGIGISFKKGRKWCDFYCPRGSFLDSALQRASRGKKIPSFLRSFRFRVLFLIFFMSVVIYNVVRLWPSPPAMGMLFVRMLIATTAAGALLAVLLHQRTWCSFCPIGSCSCAVGRARMPLMIDSEKCTGCRLCLKVCPVQLEPYKYSSSGVVEIKNGDCLKCGLCVAACPVKALGF